MDITQNTNKNEDPLLGNLKLINTEVCDGHVMEKRNTYRTHAKLNLPKLSRRPKWRSCVLIIVEDGLTSIQIQIVII